MKTRVDEVGKDGFLATTLVARWTVVGGSVVLAGAARGQGFADYLVGKNAHPATALAALGAVVFRHVPPDDEEVTVVLMEMVDTDDRRPVREIARATYVRSGTHAEAVRGQRVRMASYQN